MRKKSKSQLHEFLPRLFGSTQWERRGASLIEVMISVAIVVISALGAASFFADQTATARNVTRKSACQAALEAQMSYFRQSPSSQALAWTQETSTAPMTPIAANDTWFADSVITGGVVGQDLAPMADGSAAARTFQMNLLQQGSMGLLGQVMHSNPAICTQGVDLSSIPHKGTDAFPATVSQDSLKNFKAKIQIQPFDLASGTVDTSCPMTWARPQGQMDASLATMSPKLISFPTNTKSTIGYRVSMSGTYDTPTGPATCSSSDDFSYPVDTKAPKASVILNYYDASVNKDSIAPDAAMVPPKGRPQCTHNSGATPASLRMEIGFNSAPGVGKIEPGTMFLCRDVSQQVNGDYCPGATGAHMKGEQYDGTNAQWVPCGQVTACGLKPTNATFSQNVAHGEQKYILKYATPSAGQTQPDGLWGCDVKIDVATVDPSGNYTLLSAKPNPMNAAFSAEKGKYFQPTDCWACYKKKSSLFGAIIALVAITVFAGIVGAALFCAAGGAGLCAPKHTKFIGNFCDNRYGSSGSKFCRKVPTAYPDWFAKAAVKCPAVTTAYPGHSTITYSLPETESGGVAEDSAIDKPNAVFCEAQAICNNGNWEGFPADDGSTAPIADCGSIYTEHKLSIASTPPLAKPPTTGPSQCFIYVPDSATSHTVVTSSSYYQAYQNCPGTITGLGQNALCTYTVKSGKYKVSYPSDARTTAPNNKNPDNYYYFNVDKPLDTSLPECS